MHKHDVVQNLVFKDTNKISIYQLSALQTQTSLHGVLADFVASDTAEVCLLLANMQETTPKTINHVRVMIEEAELKISDVQRCKMFVLLLHFPPARFFQHCYPVLFLRGWDHCYLDTIAHNTGGGNVVIIYDWLNKCCFPKASEFDKPDILVQNLKALCQLLNQTVPMLSARVFFGSKRDDSFNSAMNASERSSALRVLLFERGLDEILCKRFLAYWKPSVMVKFLKKAATISKERESTLSITDSIQTQFKSLFTDFCIYILTKANEDHNLDIPYAESMSSPLQTLFLDILKIYPVPKLDQLNFQSTGLIRLKPKVDSPHFPFFHFVCNLLEKQVDLSNKTVILESDVLAETSDTNSIVGQKTTDNSTTMLLKLLQAVITDLKPQLQVSICCFVRACAYSLNYYIQHV